MPFTAPPYTPYPWADAPATSTPLDADNLDAFGSGLADDSRAVVNAYDTYASGQFVHQGTQVVSNVYLDVTTPPYSMKGDGGTATGSISSGASILTLTAGNTSKMAGGQKIYVKGAGAAGAMLTTTIQSITDATHVVLSANAGTTATAQPVVYGTDNNAAFVTAAATGHTLFFPNPSNTFYLFDVQANGSAFLQFTQNNMAIIGESRDLTILRLGPEGATAQDHVLFQLSGTQSILFRDITLQGQDFLGNSGPSTDPGTPAGSTRNYGVVHGGTAGLIRFINCRVTKFVFGAEVNATTTQASIDALFTHFQGYGSTYRSQPLGAFEATPAAWTAVKRIRCTQCRFSDFGDPTGNSFYHGVYVYTSFALDLNQCFFYTASPTSTGAAVQHFDQSVTLANASPVSRVVNCDFGPDLAAMGGFATSYNCESIVSGCTFASLTDASISIDGPVVINDCTFIANATLANPLVKTNLQGQATGLTWSGQIVNCRFRGSASTNAMNAIKIGNTSATSDFKIKSCDFDGCTSSTAIYILIFGSSTVVGGTIDISNCRFAGTPGSCFDASSSSTAMKATVQGNHFYQTSGKCIKNDTTALAALYVHDNDFSNANTTDVFNMLVAPSFPNYSIRGNVGSTGYKDTFTGVYSNTPGAVTSIAINHSLGSSGWSSSQNPSNAIVNPGNANAANAPAFYVTTDSTAVTVNFVAALTAATPYIFTVTAMRV